MSKFLLPEEAAYIAGFFDGEGGLSISNEGYLVLHFTNNDPNVLEWIHERVGGNIHCSRKSFKLQIASKDELRFCIVSIRPYVRRRYEKLDWALAYLDLLVQSRPGVKLSDTEQLKRLLVLQKIEEAV